MALVDISVLQEVTGTTLDETAWSDVPSINILIRQCSARIERFCRRKFAAADYTEFHSGNNDAFLPLRQRPINSVASVFVDRVAYWGQAPDAFATATQLVEGVDFVIVRDESDTGGSGMLYRINGVWERPAEYRPGIISAMAGHGVGNVKVAYNAGYEVIPHDVQLAVSQLVVAARRTMRVGGQVQSEGWEGYNYALADAGGDSAGALPADIVGILGPYRNYPMG